MRESDEALYCRYLERDDDADLEELLIRHREKLMLFLLSLVPDAADAEELLMDTFAKLAVGKPPFEPVRPGSFKSWLYTIARRNALMRIRRRRVQTVPLGEAVPAFDGLPDRALLREERDRELYRAMLSLKLEYRQALYLMYMEGLSHQEIARVMRMSRQQVYSLVKRGRQSLRKALEGMGIHDAQY